jgi:hypothetical protein
MKKMIKIRVHNGEGSTLVNWDNVNFVSETTSVFGEACRVIHFRGRAEEVYTSATIEEIEKEIKNL